MTIDPRLSWFAIGAAFSAVLFGWPWHSRFSRFSQFSRNIRSINYPDPAPNRQPTNPYTGKPVTPRLPSPQIKRLLAMTPPLGSSPLPPPTLEEALQSLQALAMGGQTLIEVSSDYTTVKEALLALEADAKRYRWIKRQKKGFELRADGTPWFRENGERYVCAFALAVNQTGFNGREHIDDLMDEAMAMYPSLES